MKSWSTVSRCFIILATTIVSCQSVLPTTSAFAQLDELEHHFASPPRDAKCKVLWHWVEGCVAREGITADLLAMKDVGLAGAYLMFVKEPADPPLMEPPVLPFTEPWWKCVRHAFSEADRLGLELGLHVCDGFATAGGPWITPELSMQKVVWSEVHVNATRDETLRLPRPVSAGYYRDIATLALPRSDDWHPWCIPDNEPHALPRVSTDVPGLEAHFLADPGNDGKRLRSTAPCWIQYQFERPFLARSIRIVRDGNNYQANRLRVEASDDGQAFRFVAQLDAPRHGWQDRDVEVTHAIPPTTARFFRFVWDPEGSEPGSEDLDSAKWSPVLKICGIHLSGVPRLHQFEGKSGAAWRVSPPTTETQVPRELCVPLQQIIDITEHVRAEGTCRWQPPPGNWTIMRFGHTSTGHENTTAGGARGLECDKLNAAAARMQFINWFDGIRTYVGADLSSRVLSELFIDSWECGSQNWTEAFPEQFRRRRGYELTRYLPAMAGVPIESAADSERFLRDVRRTIAELVVDEFFGTLSELAKGAGVRFTAESVAPTMVSDGMAHFAKVDVPMGEFWLQSPTHDKPNDLLDAISAAHVYGKNIVQAEAFTQLRIQWNEHPGMLKKLGDRQFCLGVNRLVPHVFVHNPGGKRPGMTLGGVGLCFQPSQIWWPHSRAWLDYLARCQVLLQAGQPVVDFALFTGDEVPSRAILPHRLISTLPELIGEAAVSRERMRLENTGQPIRQQPPGVKHSANMVAPNDWLDPLRGYKYDSINRDALLRLAEIDDGQLCLPGGARYAALVIPNKRPLNPASTKLSGVVQQRLDDLSKAGRYDHLSRLCSFTAA